MKKIKNIVGVAIVSVCLLMSAAVVFAASGTYDSTYDMYYGVVTANTWSPNAASTWKVELTPTLGVPGAIIRDQLQKDGFWGWATVDSEDVSSQNFSSVTLNGSSAGTYRIYIQEFVEQHMTGAIHIEYSW